MAAPKVNSVKLGKYVTKAGRALFCGGTKPSHFDATKIEGTIILDEDGKEDFQNFIDMHLPDALKATGIKPTAVASVFKDDTDRDGNPTGKYRIKAKTKLEFGQKFYDGSGNEFKPEAGFEIPNGSTIQMAIGVELMKTATFTGLVLRLNGTKILEFPSYTTGLEEDTGASGNFSYDAAAPVASNDVPQEEDSGDIDW